MIVLFHNANKHSKVISKQTNYFQNKLIFITINKHKIYFNFLIKSLSRVNMLDHPQQ